MLIAVTLPSVAAKQLAALEPVPLEFNLGGKRLIFDSYALDPERLIAIMSESYGDADDSR